MIPMPARFLLAGLLLCAPQLAQDPLATWLRATFPDLQRASVPQVIDAAKAAGLCRSSAEVLACKQVLRQLRDKERGARAAFRQLDVTTRPTSTAALPEAAITEVEYNDAWQWADDMGAATTAVGSVLDAADVDVFRFQSTGQFYSVSVGPGSNPTIQDSTLTIRNASGQPIAFNDNDGTPLSTLNLYLPPGTCYFEVGSHDGLGGGNYTLTVVADPANLQALSNSVTGATQIARGGVAHDVFTFTVPEGRLSLRAQMPTGDSFLVIQRSDGALLFTNDNSGQFGSDAAADVDLPAGSYFAYVSDVFNRPGLPFSLSYGFTPQAIPELTVTPAVADTLLGDESLRLYRVTLTAPQRIDFLTGSSGLVPVWDTVLSYCDRDLNFVCDCDDDDPIAGHGHYSRLRLDLPATVGYLAVTPFSGRSGGFALSGAVGQPFVAAGSAGFGSNLLAYSGHGLVNTYTLDNGTQASTRFRTDSYWYAVLDQNGDLANVWSGISTVPQGGELPAAVPGQSNYVVCWDRDDWSGPIEVDILPPCAVENAALVTHGKQDDVTILFGALRSAAPVNLGIGDRGMLLCAMNSIVTLGIQIVPAGGVCTWAPQPPLPYQIVVQSADLHTGVRWSPGPGGTWRNLLGF
jgi:hypothetical protein